MAAGRLSPEEAENHPYGNVITRAVGPSESVAPDYVRLDVVDGDRFVICSDGLTKELTDYGIQHFLVENADPAAAVDGDDGCRARERRTRQHHDHRARCRGARGGRFRARHGCGGRLLPSLSADGRRPQISAARSSGAASAGGVGWAGAVRLRSRAALRPRVLPRPPFERPGEPLELPPPWNPPSRPAVPLLASVVPVLGAVALWLVTGSVLSLWLAALGPLIAGATLLDGARGARRDRRRAEQAARAARERVGQQIAERHAEERARRWARHPGCRRLRRARRARSGVRYPGRADVLVVGAGRRCERAAGRTAGGTTRSRRRSGRAPRGSRARRSWCRLTRGSPSPAARCWPARSSARSWLQLAMSLPPGELRIVGPLRGENAWAEQLPHRRAGSGLTLALGAPGEPSPDDADIRHRPGRPRRATTAGLRGRGRGALAGARPRSTRGARCARSRSRRSASRRPWRSPRSWPRGRSGFSERTTRRIRSPWRRC